VPDASHAAAHAALTLLALPRVGVREWHRRCNESGGAAAALSVVGNTNAVTAAALQADAILASAQQLCASLLVHGEAHYPVALHDLSDCENASVTPAPPVLFAMGNVALLTAPTLAIVGTRHATATGLRVAERIARECSDAGATVVSGLARGIDAAAHTGALDGAASTCAVIGTGLDIAYPSDHRALQARIAREGLLITELAPGQRANRGSFPERNRLIAALASVTLVVEAGHKSGALLTARVAEALGRPCAAVPGAFDSAASQGSNLLLRDGAQVIATVEDLLTLLRIGRPDNRAESTPPALTDAERAIWNVISTTPLELDVVVERTGWAADACLAAVTMLELKGLVRATHAGALHRV
jgi:DNA processing protein